MNYLPAQFLFALATGYGGGVLAARKSYEENGWIEILIFIIFLAFSVLSSIVSKIKSNKTAAKGKDQPPGKPARKPPELTIDLRMLKQLFGLPEEAESSSQPSPEESEPQAAKPQVVKQQVQPEVRKVARPQPVARKMPIETSKITAMEPQVQPKLEKVSGLTDETEVSTEIPQTKHLSDILSDYEDAEKLRRVILHSEILGKPLSLREQERVF